MGSALLFAEDDAQEKFVGTLARRLFTEAGVELELRIRSAQGGFASMLNELQRFRMNWKRDRVALPDALIVAADANCRGLSECKKQIDARLGDLSDWSLQAIADPHVERWFLLDGHAFQQVLGRGCAGRITSARRDTTRVCSHKQYGQRADSHSSVESSTRKTSR